MVCVILVSVRRHIKIESIKQKLEEDVTMFFPIELFQRGSRPDLSGIEVIYANIPPVYEPHWITFCRKHPNVTILPFEMAQQINVDPSKACFIAPYKYFLETKENEDSQTSSKFNST